MGVLLYLNNQFIAVQQFMTMMVCNAE